MRINDVIKIDTKEEFYLKYLGIIDDPKEYEYITRKQIMNAVVTFYIDDYNNIIESATYDELMLLKKISDGNLPKTLTHYEIEMFEILEKSLIVFSDPTTNEFLILEELRNQLEIALDKINKEELQTRDELYYLIIGLIRIYCIIPVDTFYDILSNYISISFDDFLDILQNNLYIKKLVNTILDEQGEGFCISDEYLEFNEYVLDNFDMDFAELGVLYGKNEIVSIGKNKLNLENKSINTFLDFIYSNSQNEVIANIIINAIIEQFNILYFEYSSTEFFESLITLFDLEPGLNGKLSEKYTIFEDFINNLPLWVLGGSTPLKAAELFATKLPSMEPPAFEKVEIQLTRSSKCPCGSGLKFKRCCLDYNKMRKKGTILSSDDGELFYDLFNNLLLYTNEKHNLVLQSELYSILINRMIPFHTDFVDTVRSKMWEDNSIINSYLKDSTNLTKEQIDILKSWKKRITSHFLLIDYEDGKAVLMHEDKVYVVSGIFNSWSEKIHFDSLPVLVGTTLLPFKDKIVYDVLFSVLPISIGGNILNLIEEEIVSNDFIRKID